MDRLSKAWDRFWFEDEVSYTRLLALRWALFGLVAFDLWSVMLHHASRYGAGDFNVAQVGILDAMLPVPTPAIISAGVLITGFFALRAALGISVRLSMVMSTIGYFGIYLWSQADSYQHHYLVALLMTISCFAPDSLWSRAQTGEPESSEVEQDVDDESSGGRWHWAIRLVYVQLALLYFWTAVTKCDPTWLSGITMDQVTSEPSVRSFMGSVDVRFGWAAGESYRAAAWMTMLGEFFAALVFLIPKLRILGLLIVPWFHIGVEVLGFDIELFSYYMIAIDLILLSPAALWRRLDGLREVSTYIASLDARSPTGSASIWFLVVFVAIGCGLITAPLPFESSYVAGTLIALFAGLSIYRSSHRQTLWTAVGGNILAAVAMTTTVYAADSAYDYYRMWGGDLKRRGQYEEAAERYILANSLMSDRPARRVQLGKIYERLGRGEDALELYQESVVVLNGYLSELTIRAHKDPTEPDHHFELAENHLRLASSCRALHRIQTQQGLPADESEVCRLQALGSTEDALNEGIKLSPNDRRRSYKIQRHLRKAKRQR